jgi:two-component system chemotaxis response regulator CheB
MRYRCHTGHAFSEKSLLTEQSISIEEAVYAALRAMEEKAAALRKLSQRWSERFPQMEVDYQARASELDASARVLRRLLAKGMT